MFSRSIVLYDALPAPPVPHREMGAHYDDPKQVAAHTLSSQGGCPGDGGKAPGSVRVS
ncbi:MAG: hypothetical protein WCB46_00125 [Methanoregula sp.]